jgi:hypothetical protein
MMTNLYSLCLIAIPEKLSDIGLKSAMTPSFGNQLFILIGSFGPIPFLSRKSEASFWR